MMLCFLQVAYYHNMPNALSLIGASVVILAIVISALRKIMKQEYIR